MILPQAILIYLDKNGLLIQQQEFGELLYITITADQFKEIFENNDISLNDFISVEFELNSWKFNEKYYTKASLITIHL
jgi:hypothetical protein